jgi:hypothetical protein
MSKRRDESGSQAGEGAPRRTYDKPGLTVYGSIPDRTLASDMGASFDGVSMVDMQDPSKGKG